MMQHCTRRSQQCTRHRKRSTTRPYGCWTSYAGLPRREWPSSRSTSSFRSSARLRVASYAASTHKHAAGRGSSCSGRQVHPMLGRCVGPSRRWWSLSCRRRHPAGRHTHTMMQRTPGRTTPQVATCDPTPMPITQASMGGKPPCGAHSSKESCARMHQQCRPSRTRTMRHPRPTRSVHWYGAGRSHRRPLLRHVMPPARCVPMPFAC